jgi:hypothetical protein
VLEKFNRQIVYYFSFDEKTKPFPEGFHMIFGNPRRRSMEEPVINRTWNYPIDDEVKQENLAKRSIGFLCIEHIPLGTFDRQLMFTKEEMDMCTGGFQANIRSPSCWNGKPALSNEDMSHLAYSDSQLDGPCPDSHPERLPTLLFETTYETQKFKGVPGYYMFNTGDREGIYHLPTSFTCQSNAAKQGTATMATSSAAGSTTS